LGTTRISEQAFPQCSMFETLENDYGSQSFALIIVALFVPTAECLDNNSYFNKLKFSSVPLFRQNVSDSGHRGSKYFTDFLFSDYLIDFSKE
jgi:hypothetical protein